MLPWLLPRPAMALKLGILLAICCADGSSQGRCSAKPGHGQCRHGPDSDLSDDKSLFIQMKVTPEQTTQNDDDNAAVLSASPSEHGRLGQGEQLHTSGATQQWAASHIALSAERHPRESVANPATPISSSPDAQAVPQQLLDLAVPQASPGSIKSVSEIALLFQTRATRLPLLDADGVKALWERGKMHFRRHVPMAEYVTPATSLVLLIMMAVCVAMFFPVEKLDLIAMHTPDWLMVIGFLVFSSLMLVANKLTMVVIPLPATVLAFQLLFCAIILRMAAWTGVFQLDQFSARALCRFAGVPLSFSLCLYTSLRVLLYSNVETTIMIRSMVPLVTSVTDVFLFDRQWPSLISWCSLGLIGLSTVGFVHFDAAIDMRSYFWGAAWLGAFFFDISYVKHIMNSVPMSTWTRVYYNNLIAGLFLLIPACLELHEAGAHPEEVNHFVIAGALLCSSILGAGLSFSAFRARVYLNATGFAVLNHVAKIFTILINASMWDRHASPAGMLALMVGFGAASMYEEAPERVKLNSRQQSSGHSSDAQPTRAVTEQSAQQ